MFDTLGDRLDDIFKKLRSRGRLTEKEIDEALREIRVALLEADVALPAVRTFLQHVKAEALGEEVLKSLTPGQQVIKIVHDELVRMLGGQTVGLATASKPPTIIMLAGLQGSGKTSTAAKLAVLLRRKGQRPLLVAADLQSHARLLHRRWRWQHRWRPPSREWPGAGPAARSRCRGALPLGLGR